MKNIFTLFALMAIVFVTGSCSQNKESPPESLKEYMEDRNFSSETLEIYAQRPKQLHNTTKDFQEITGSQGRCFNQKELKECRKCAQTTSGYFASNGEYCVSHYDYQTANDNGVVDNTDRNVTQSDFQFATNHLCSREPHVIAVNKDLPPGAIDFAPGCNPFVNESCFQTTWDNLSAVMIDGLPNYFLNWPEWSADSTVLHKNRFQFFWEVKTPTSWPEADSIPYTLLEVGWYLLPINDYGNMGVVCEGLQELVCIVRDNYTGVWYNNSQVVNANVLCNGQGMCGQGYDFNQLEYVDYTAGFLYVSDPYY